MPSPRARRSRPARGEARERIVLAAARAFAEKGFEAASTREIAERAGTDQGLVTYHFPSKDRLWRAAADHVFGTLTRRLDERVLSVTHRSPRERARLAIRESVRWSAEHPAFFRFLVDTGNRSGARARWLVDTYIRPRFEYMQTHGLVPTLGLDPSDAPHAFYALAGAAGLIFAVAPNCRRLTGVDPLDPDVVEAHADFVARLIVP
ncbi:MAG: TetR/AcrR family transcriptional regulator [Myxococcota bacterium]